MRSIRSINTMSGIRNFTIAVACNIEAYPQVVTAIGASRIEVCYVHTFGAKNSASGSYV